MRCTIAEQTIWVAWRAASGIAVALLVLGAGTAAFGQNKKESHTPPAHQAPAPPPPRQNSAPPPRQNQPVPQSQRQAQPAYRPQPQPSYRPQPQPAYRPQPQAPYHPQPQAPNRPQPQPSYRPQPQPAYHPQPQAPNHPQPQPSYRPQPQPAYRPQTQVQPQSGAGGPRGPVTNREQRPPRDSFHPGPQVIHGPNQAIVNRDAHGRVRVVRAPGVTVVHGPGGTVHVTREMNGRVVVTDRTGRGGYAQQRFVYRGHEFARRTYFINGHQSVSVYRPYRYRGAVYHVYTPMRYYRPGFYVYAYRPWPRPIVYRWGWYGEPWYAYYRPYFAPYPVYPGPAFWLTDYLVAATFQAAYQEQANQAAYQEQANQPAPMTGQPINDQIKQSISEEVQRQLEAEQQESSRPATSNESEENSSLPVIEGGSHTLLVSTSMNVASDSGDCAITAGDVLQTTAANPAPGQDSVQVRVLWSKGQDCAASSNIMVPIEQLQEMQNQMRSNLDQGLSELQTNQGQNGLPQLPASLVGSTTADYASEAPPPEPNIADELKQSASDGMQVEQASIQASNASYVPAQQIGNAGTQTVTEGQTPDQVIAILGQPTRIFSVGAKKIFQYPRMKITFLNDRLSDIE
jgi:hypothetical protein